MITYSFNCYTYSTFWDGRPPTLPDQISAAAAAGYDYIGLDVPSLTAHETAGLPPSAIRHLLDEAGISAYEVGALSISDDAALTEASLAEVLHHVRPVGGQQVLAVVRSGLDDATVANTRRCVEELSSVNVGVSVEFLPSLDVFNSIESVLALIDAVDHPGLGVMVDSWHFFAGPSTWESLDQLPLERLGFVQFSDAAPPVSDDVTYEYRERRVLPGEGIHDVAQFASRLCQRTDDLTVSVEILSKAWRDQPPAVLAEASYEATRRLWERG